MSTWRTKSYTLKLSPTRRLIITLRRFRTKKTNRAKSYRQLVLPTLGGEAREVAFRYKAAKRRTKRISKTASKSKAAKAPKLSFISNEVRPRIVASTVLVIVGLSGMGWFGSQIVHGQGLDSLKTFSSAAPAKEVERIKPLPRSEPVHITVPSVGIDAPVGAVGTAADGSIDVPPVDQWTTGWYKHSPTPGEKGPAVIVGHVDSYKGISVFWRLREIKQGDTINVKRADGTRAKFRVQALKQFDQANFPTKEVYGDIGYPGLRLITCSGSFNKETASYSQNTVVYAFMVK